MHKLKVVNFLLKINIAIGRRLAFYQAKFKAHQEVEKAVKQEKFDLRGMGKRLKNVFLHDEDIINKRWAECEKCEFLVKATNQFTKCKCFMKVKTRVATASCPIGKWGKEYNFIEGKKVNGINTTT